MNNKSIDLNGVLVAANVLIVVLLISIYRSAVSSPYIDQTSIVLTVVLAMQTHIALWIERRRRDPFALLLAAEMIFYYALRIYTLWAAPYSTVFDRWRYTPADTNYALVFVIVANIYLYAGLFAVRTDKLPAVSTAGWRPAAPAGVIAMMLLAIAFAYASGNYESAVPRIFEVLELFISQYNILMMALVYFLLFRKSLSRIVATVIALLLLGELVMHTLIGSRAALLNFLENCLLVVLAISGCLKIRRAYLWLGVALLPFFVAALVGAFAISTYNRAAKVSGQTLDLRTAWGLLQDIGLESAPQMGVDVLLPSIFARAGYFDFSAEVIAHREQYAPLLNAYVYSESIVDNLLTPGFDIYDEPKTSNAMQFLYRDLGPPSKIAVADNYQSDQLGIYGEFYDLFGGYLSLPLMFLLAYATKRLYARLRDAKPYMLTIKRVLVLFLFTEVLRSFGLDWFICEAVPMVATVYLYSVLFTGRRVSTGAARPAAGAIVAPGSATG